VVVGEQPLFFGPIIPGHEIVGIVTAKGDEVFDLNIGDRVGVGTQCFSCLEDTCKYCSKHEEQYCRQRLYTFNDFYNDGSITYGGFAKYIRMHHRFAVKIPEGLDPFKTAPLFCAGITCYDPLTRYGVVGKKVGVIGVGGIGHLAIKFAVALGNQVVGFSRSNDKRESVLALGAHDHVNINENSQLSKYYKYFDFILSTVDKATDWEKIFNLIEVGGHLILLGIPKVEDSNIPMSTTIFERITVSGSNIGSPSKMKEMLNFCLEKNITPDVQVFPVSEINKAWSAFKEGKPKFRYVIKME